MRSLDLLTDKHARRGLCGGLGQLEQHARGTEGSRGRRAFTCTFFGPKVPLKSRAVSSGPDAVSSGLEYLERPRVSRAVSSGLEPSRAVSSPSSNFCRISTYFVRISLVHRPSRPETPEETPSERSDRVSVPLDRTTSTFGPLAPGSGAVFSLDFFGNFRPWEGKGDFWQNSGVARRPSRAVSSISSGLEHLERSRAVSSGLERSRAVSSRPQAISSDLTRAARPDARVPHVSVTRAHFCVHTTVFVLCNVT